MALSSCCCCISLRTGGLILAVISAVSSLVMFTNGIKAEAGSLSVVQGVGMVFYSLCVYGIIKEKPGLMMPSLIWSIISVILSIIAWILLIVGYLALKQINPDNMTPDQKEALAFFQIAVVVFSIIYIFSAALALYFWCVLYALYQLLKNPSGGNVV